MNALIAMAILEQNSEDTVSGVKSSLYYLAKAHALEPTNSTILSHLSNHYFYSSDYGLAQKYALEAINHTDLQKVKSECFYQLGRIFHVQVSFPFIYFSFIILILSLNFDSTPKTPFTPFQTLLNAIYRTISTKLLTTTNHQSTCGLITNWLNMV